MKESVSHQAPKVMYAPSFLSLELPLTNKRGCSKKLQFSLLNNQEAVKLAEFEVTHRDLYTPIDRLPVKNGVLDRRLVRVLLA